MIGIFTRFAKLTSVDNPTLAATGYSGVLPLAAVALVFHGVYVEMAL